jgi:hypothetical protein
VPHRLQLDPEQTAAPATAAVANIAGKWRLTVDTPQGVIEAQMLVEQTGHSIRGKLDTARGSVDYTGTVERKKVNFSYDISRFGAPPGSKTQCTGTIESNEMMKGKAVDEMKGTAFESFGGGGWIAKRE